MPWQPYKRSQESPSPSNSSIADNKEYPEEVDYDKILSKSRQRRRPSYLDEFDVQVSFNSTIYYVSINFGFIFPQN